MKDIFGMPTLPRYMKRILEQSTGDDVELGKNLIIAKSRNVGWSMSMYCYLLMHNPEALDTPQYKHLKDRYEQDQ